MIHQPGRFYILVEVEKDAAQSVFFYLKEHKTPVFIEPTEDLIEKYFPDQQETIIVKSLVSEAPLQTINNINIPIACYRDWETDRKSTRLNSSHSGESRMPSSA